MNISFTIIENNLGMSMGLIVLFVLTIGAIIFFAKSFQIGSLLLLLSSTGSFMLSYSLSWNYTPSIIMMFVSIIILSFSLYATGKVTTQQQGLL